jgi:alkylation response protein AidB-like acyl-CoA dehydrogenase
VAEIAAACGSTAFKTVIQAGCSYIAALLPDEAQDEIFTSPDVKVGGTLVPDATAVRSGGGYVVNGTSGFATGCHDADWQLLTVRVASDSGDGPPEVLWTAVPMAELEILDDWHVSGLAGTGSNSVVARDVFVPGHRALPIGPLPTGEFSSKRSADDPFYRMPVLLMFCAWTAPNALGLARSALSEFTERSHRRGITYTFHARQNEATVTHLQVAEAAMKISCAELLTADFISVMESRAESGEPYPPEERARIRARAHPCCRSRPVGDHPLRSGLRTRSRPWRASSAQAAELRFVRPLSRKRRSRVSGQVLITSSLVSQPRCAVPTP